MLQANLRTSLAELSPRSDLLFLTRFCFYSFFCIPNLDTGTESLSSSTWAIGRQDGAAMTDKGRNLAARMSRVRPPLNARLAPISKRLTSQAWPSICDRRRPMIGRIAISQRRKIPVILTMLLCQSNPLLLASQQFRDHHPKMQKTTYHSSFSFE